MVQQQRARVRGNKFSISIAVLLLGAMLLLQACGNQAGNTASGEEQAGGVPSVLNYGYIGVNELNLPRAAEGWGLHKGIIQAELKKHGITEVKLSGFPNGPDLSESLISGRLDIGSLGDTPAILARSSGAKTRLITQASTDNIGYLIGRKDLKDKKELQGKTIAIQKGSFMHRYVVGLLKKEGITDYKLIHMLRPDGEAALARGEVDAMTNNGVYALKLIEEGFSHLDDATKHPELYGSNATVVSEEYLKKFPDFPKVWNEAREKALEDLKKHPEEYYQFIADIQKTTPELAKKTAPIEWIKDEPFTDPGIELLEGTKNFLVEEKLAENDFDIKEWILK
ncbi:ABC transporter substrate-binding protein [Paenibacillus oenotherae]|uniref:ABC transporter substrate-binding protein n=1 Tax=Paenibacillus oenotherae TaxID=1435645 RepID=A0ABS7DBE8_9BACL|nr:ABC transporter substrate-binding protein [Paenibacillus oenotherae]MBW7477180.1 ABC transporter substrate-binding protein [Paenibacillus oenotherae]